MEHEFTDVEVKKDAPSMLEKALQRKRQKCMIGTGAMSDPYLHLEGELLYTRKCLELIYHYGFGLAIQTKSDMILRDIDLLKGINERSKCFVQITLTTYNEDSCRIIEPNVCTTKRRFEVLRILHENGIPTVVWLCPILPFINDTEENLSGLLDYCNQAKVSGILCFGMGMTLRNGNREYFYRQLDKYYPGLKEKYQTIYGNRYGIRSPNHSKLMKTFAEYCRKNRLNTGNDKIFSYMHQFENKQTSEQMTLF